MFTKKRSKIHNTGLFATSDIAQGTRIVEYAGEKITAREGDRRVEASLNSHRKNGTNGAVYIFYLSERYSLDGNVPYNQARRMNHSCDPNTDTDIIRGKIWIIAIRDIKKGEEITFNYGYEFRADYKDHPCRCGSRQCVGYILHRDEWPKLRRVTQKHPVKKGLLCP
jgi:SET domain-containing protein